MPIEKPNVGDLLERSRAAHLQYRQFTPHKRSVGGRLVTMPGDPVKARAALELAGELRKAAHDADPDQADPAWERDHAVSGVESHKLLTFHGEHAITLEARAAGETVARGELEAANRKGPK